MNMRYSYQLKRSCGNVYGNGNIIFTADGNTVLAPIGNRINIFDLLHQTTECLPIETKKDIHIITLSHNAKYLIIIDEEGYGLFYHFHQRLLLHQFHFRQRVFAIRFSWNDQYFAVTYGRGCQIWKTPSAVREFIPLKLLKTISGHYDETVALNWSANSKHLILGSKDLTCRVYFNAPTKYMTLSVLVGHRDEVLGVYFSHDDKHVYTIAGDGGVFVWQYARITLPAKSNSTNFLQYPSKKRKNHSRGGEDEETESDEEENTSDEDQEEEEPEDLAQSSLRDDLEENSGDGKVNFKTNRSKSQGVKLSRKGNYQLLHRHLLRDNQQGDISCTCFHKPSNLLVLGFSAGIFGIYEMPDCTNIHRLSVSSNSISSIEINSTGEWLAAGITASGQLLVWEWKSESYILKQQGHSYGLNVLDFSSEGQFVATGGDDGKVKIWNTFSGFCVVTFKEHLGPVTGVKFIGQSHGKAIISASLDGTIRAHDLLRYKNFRTLTSPQAVQFTSLTADSSGDIVCAGSQDPFQIFIWSLQTAKLLEILAGHEGPIANLAYSSSTGILASGSWDGTLKLWDIYNNSCIETFEHGCDVLALAFRSDGKEIACTATDGNIYIWDADSGEQKKIIEGRRDLAGGRITTDRKTKENMTKSKYFTSISYSADGSTVLVGGRSKYLCMYCIETGVLVKKFQLSHNRSLEGIVDRLRSDRLVDGVSMDNLNAENRDDTTAALSNYSTSLPGAVQNHKGHFSVNTKLLHPEIMTFALQFSTTGKEFAVVSTEGLQIYSLDLQFHFLPMELDLTISPENIHKLFQTGNYTSAIQMAVILHDYSLLEDIIERVPKETIEIITKQFNPKYLKEFIEFLTERLEKSKKLEFYLFWIFLILQTHSVTMQRMITTSQLCLVECFRNLLRIILSYEKELLQLMNKNSYLLEFVIAQLSCQQSSTVPIISVTQEESEETEGFPDIIEIRDVAEIEEEDVGKAVFADEEMLDNGGMDEMFEEDEGMPWKSAWEDEDDDEDDANIISLHATDENPVETDRGHWKGNKKSHKKQKANDLSEDDFVSSAGVETRRRKKSLKSK